MLSLTVGLYSFRVCPRSSYGGLANVKRCCGCGSMRSFPVERQVCRCTGASINQTKIFTVLRSFLIVMYDVGLCCVLTVEE